MKHRKTEPAAERSGGNRKGKKIAFTVILILLLGVMAFSGWKVAKVLLQYRAGDKTYDGAADAFITVVDEDEPASQKPETSKSQNGDAAQAPEHQKKPPIQVDMAALQAQYPDVVGWIYCAGTVINYPVMQYSDDNLFYVEHLYNGEWNPGGAIFLDFRNDSLFGDSNSVLYGHHMNDGSMFASLVKYAKEGYYQEHPVMWLVTPEGTYRLDIFSGYVTPATSDAYTSQFSSREEYADWLDSRCSQSHFTSTVVPTAEDKVITLSTCTYDFQDARYVVHAVMTPVEAE